MTELAANVDDTLYEDFIEYVKHIKDELFEDIYCIDDVITSDDEKLAYLLVIASKMCMTLAYTFCNKSQRKTSI